jgi:hypothetical protein
MIIYLKCFAIVHALQTVFSLIAFYDLGLRGWLHLNLAMLVMSTPLIAFGLYCCCVYDDLESHR